MRAPFRSLVRACLLPACLVLYVSTVHAQGARAREHKARADSLATVVRGIEQRITTADSLRDPVTAAQARLELAALVHPKTALQLVEEAVAALDTAGAPELALRAHQELADRYTASKAYEKANAQWSIIVAITGRMRDEAKGNAEARATEIARLEGEVEDLTGRLDRAVGVMAQRQDAQARREALSLDAMVAGLVLLALSVVFFTWHAGRQRKALERLRIEKDHLRAEAAEALRAKELRPPSVPVAPPGTATTAAPAPPVAPARVVPCATFTGPTADDAMLLAMVRRMGEARLNTLRDARARGDNDKVVRVVHTMKPQLVAIDAPYFQDLCGRITGAVPGADPVRWAEDLDRFEQGMARVLGRA